LRRRRVRYVVVAAVLVAALAFLVTRIGGSLDYFETVDQATAHEAALGSKTIRLEGLVVPGSVQRTATGVDFVAAGTTHRIAVENTGSPPQLFQPDVPVVVVGHFAGSTFLSDQIIVDHSATYVEQHPGRVRAPDGSTR
jgi:cytochrome c-type biogenesis protein CcmE